MKKKSIIISTVISIVVIVLSIIFTTRTELRLIGNDKIEITDQDQIDMGESNIVAMNCVLWFCNDASEDVLIETNAVEGEVGEYLMTYKFKSNELERQIKITDTTPPVITLKGDTVVTLKYGDKYLEQGYEVTDNYSKNLDKKIQIDSEFDSTRPGTYTIKYSVADAAGNQGSAVRTIIVKPQNLYENHTINSYISELEQYIKDKKYDVSIGYYDLESGASYNYRADEIYYGASLIKTADALYIYEKTEPTQYNKNLVSRAISVSDNNAHEALALKQIGLSNLRNYGAELGLQHFLKDPSSYYTDTNVNDQMILWKHLWEFINTNPSGDELKSYFINTYYNNLIFDNNITVMHKYGWMYENYHDAGIVLSEHPYIVVILTRSGYGNFPAVVRDLSARIYQLSLLSHS